MRRKTAYFWLCSFSLLCLSILSYYEAGLNATNIQFVTVEPIETNSFELPQNTISIGMWNLQIFGVKKGSNKLLVEKYVDVIIQHDIFVIQEIRDKSGQSYESLCDNLRNYSYVCLNSSRSGRSSSKEQYGVIFKNTFAVKNITDYNLHYSEEFERPPFEVTFETNTTRLTLITIHTKPTDVNLEMAQLDNLFKDRNQTIIIGDLNADCSYYKTGNHFASWLWIINNDVDTTLGKSDCAYDRILFSPDLTDSFGEMYGITTQDINSNLSDHYPIWVAFTYK